MGSESRRAQVVALYQSGLSGREIAAQLKISRDTVAKMLRPDWCEKRGGRPKSIDGGICLGATVLPYRCRGCGFKITTEKCLVCYVRNSNQVAASS